MGSKVTYHLKQETPMWHFQCREKSGMQEGAVLRGSDVKPRLDKFLIRQLEADNYAWEKFKTLPEHNALNYKIRIDAIGESSHKDMGEKAFFANMGKDIDPEKSVFYSEGVNLTIICFIPELMEIINKHIRGFFLTHNFGTRQDKGFGSFYIDKKDDASENVKMDSVLKQYSKTEKYTAYAVNMNGCSDNKILDNAYVLYQWMKSGINFKNTYKKSLLTLYMLDKGIGGEKRWMKQEGIAPAIGRKEDHNKDLKPEYRYIRAVLGMSGDQSWKNEENKRERITVSSAIQNEKDKIKRFQSQITIKAISGQIYFIAFDLDRADSKDNNDKKYTYILDKEFSFQNRSKKGKIKTPSEFNMEEFMDYCVKRVVEDKEPFKLSNNNYRYTMKKV